MTWHRERAARFGDVWLLVAAIVAGGIGGGCERAVGMARDAAAMVDGTASGTDAAGPGSDAAAPDAARARCGDGEVGGLEQCDDGNRLDGDGCSAQCRWECDMVGGGCQCDWEALYAVAIYGAPPSPGLLRCPGGSNCVPGDLFAEDCALTPGPDACRPVSEGYTCSVITEQLMSDPSRRCTDLAPSFRCWPLDPAAPQPTMTGGSLIGFCQDVGRVVATTDLWQNCQYMLNAPCVAGAVCVPWGGFDEGWGTCVPLCDTADPAGSDARCVGSGGPSGAQCRSFSLLCDPAPPAPHVRLGRCE